MKKIIFIGTSGPMLYYINYLFESNFLTCNHNIVIIQSNKKEIGGSWHSINNEYFKNIDHAIHFIPIYGDYYNIIKKLKMFNLDVDKIDSNNLIIEYDNYKKFSKNGLLYAKKSWHTLINNLYNRLKSYNNVKFIYKTVNKISEREDYVNIFIENNIIKNDKLYIPAYISLNNIEINNKIIYLKNDNNDLNKKIKTYHLLLYLKTDKIKYNENFHAIYDDIDIFDRVMFVTNKDNIISDKINLVSILRISRSYKNKINKIKNIKEKAYKFLFKNKLIYSSHIIDYNITKYEYYFRYKSFQENMTNIEKLTNKIRMVDTRDLGNIISSLN